MNKKILFMLFISIGSVAVALSIYYTLGVANVAEYVALFTSISTAIYAILAEPKAKTEPFLRITPILRRPPELIAGSMLDREFTIDVWIENIGYSIAKDIEVKCKLVPDTSMPLEKNGVFKHPLLAPKEIVKYYAVGLVESSKLLPQRLIIETHYLNEDNKKQKPIKKEFAVRELEQGLREVKTGG